MSMPSLPKLVAFDLDYTLWDLWIDTHVTPPLRQSKAQPMNCLEDRHGTKIAFYPDVPSILFELRAQGVQIAACSRTHAPDVAHQALQLLALSPNEHTSEAVKAIDLFDYLEIFPGSKILHFQNLVKQSGMRFEDMLFFDDEMRNQEVTKLGVTFALVKTGLDCTTFEKGLQKWETGSAPYLEP